MSYRLLRGVMVPLFAAAAATLPAFRAGAQDFVKDTIPQKWIDPYVPEDLPALDFRAYDDDLSKAEQQVFSGRYKLALFNARKIKDPKPELLPRVALVKGRALAARGRYQEAIDALQDAKVADSPDVQVLQAELLSDLGRTDEATLLLKQHLKAHPESIPGHYWLGRVNEQIGDLESAKQAYGWFVEPAQNFLERWNGRQFVGASGADTAERVTTVARALDRWAQLNAKYRDNVKLHGTILNMFVRAYDVIDRGYWPAHVAAAEYFMGHDQNKEALAELQGDEETKSKGALDYNPNAARALELIGLIALDGYNFDAADRVTEAIRKVNPNSPRADLLEARNLMLQRRPQDAIRPVQKVLSAQPKNLEALGLLASVYALQLKDDQMAEVLKQVEAIDPDNATAYFEVADRLGAVRQYPRAAEKYKVAIERAPWWTAPRNGLGLLYTQSGDEKGARAVIEEARKLDPFNLATTNYIRLLDDMDHFAQKETEHFIVMYNPELDPVIPEYFSDYMESVHAEICAEFKTEPRVKTMIEVFPTHDAFSVRTTGSPWIGTVGASTGRVIALVSPRAGGDQMGTFNWAQVLRHEYTHTVTLAATDNRIAHWLTEGLAVYQEHTPMRWDWVPMLYNAVKKKELFSMEDLTWAFVRPKKPWHRTLAYAESFWVCKFVEEKWGHDAILRMLEEFRKGGHQDDVFPKVLGEPIPAFEKEFFAWTERQVAGWGYDEETSKKSDELKEKAEGLIKARQYAEAAEAWEEIAKLRPADALPHQRLAGLYVLTKQTDKAIAHFNALYQVELKDNRIAKRVARMHAEAGELDKAHQAALQAVYIAPYDLSAHELLADICQKAGDQKGLERERRVIPMLKKWMDDRKKEGPTAGAN